LVVGKHVRAKSVRGRGEKTKMTSNHLNFETLNFKIGLTATYWGRKPQYTVLLNGTTYAEGQCDDSTLYVKFSADVLEDRAHCLEIRLENKTNLDTVVQGNEIVKDMLLNIDSIEIDDIELGEVKWNKSEFRPDDPNKPTLTRCVNLGWNGSYQLKFSSPFYLWLLDNT